MDKRILVVAVILLGVIALGMVLFTYIEFSTRAL